MWKRVLLFLVLGDFVFLTIRATLEFGYMGVIDWFMANAATQLLFADLTISLVLISIWMFKDARVKGRNVWPYFGVTLFFGVAGPLMYLLLGQFDEATQQAPARAAS